MAEMSKFQKHAYTSRLIVHGAPDGSNSVLAVARTSTPMVIVGVDATPVRRPQQHLTHRQDTVARALSPLPHPHPGRCVRAPS